MRAFLSVIDFVDSLYRSSDCISDAFISKSSGLQRLKCFEQANFTKQFTALSLTFQRAASSSRWTYRAARSLRSKYRISCRTAGSSFVPLSLSTAMSVSSSRPGWQSPEEKTIIVSVRPESGRHMHR